MTRRLMGFGLIGTIIHVISPLILIWSLNTLFNTGIPYSFKTWLAVLLVIYVVRFHIRPERPYDPFLFEDEDDEEDDEDEEDEEDEDEIQEPQARAETSKQTMEALERFQAEQKSRKGKSK